MGAAAAARRPVDPHRARPEGVRPQSPRAGRDFEICAGDVAQVLSELGPAHLVGHSYGGVVSLLAAARVPELVRSLAVIEPPAFGVAADDPDVLAFVTRFRALQAQGPAEPDAFLRDFLQLAGFAFRQPGPLPNSILQHARLLQTMRPPEEAEIPLAELRNARFPKLVVSGCHSAAFERVSDIVAAEVGGRRAGFPGAGHAAQRIGASFKGLIEEFWTDADAGF